MGAVEYVAIEVLVGNLVRRAMGLKMNWAEATEIHAYSLPVIGQLNFGEPFPPLSKDPKATIEIMKQATEGAKAIPGAIAGYTAYQIRQSGFKIPSYGNRDFIAVGGENFESAHYRVYFQYAADRFPDGPARD